MAGVVTEKTPPACTFRGCGAQAGDRWCYTATGFRRHMHAVRRRLIAGEPAAEKSAGSLAGRKPTDAQAKMLGAAIATDDGLFEVSGYNHHGDAQRRATMKAMTDPARGWFTFAHSTAHCEVYRITDAGRAAWQRYDDWMHGRKP